MQSLVVQVAVVSPGNDAAHSSVAAVVRAERSSDGRSTARYADDAQVRSAGRITVETTMLDFRRFLEKHQLAAAIFKQINAYLARKA